jgi:transglutaminase-like putative cysteine protease
MAGDARAVDCRNPGRKIQRKNQGQHEGCETIASRGAVLAAPSVGRRAEGRKAMTQSVDRREMLKAGAAFGALALMPAAARATPEFAPKPGGWRRFEVTTRVEISGPGGASRAWLPMPAVDQEDWLRRGGDTWRSNGQAAEIDAASGAKMLQVQWTAEETAPFVELVSIVATRNRAVDFDGPAQAATLSAGERDLYLAGSRTLPIDGAVGRLAEQIVAGTGSDIDKARAIYSWVVAHSCRDPAVRGCGTGDVAALLRTENLGGKCADINGLFVALSRAAGVPARNAYGVRVAPSRFGYKSLGAGPGLVTKAQHCRAEVFLASLGWVPADPADVRKVMLEEPPGHLVDDDPKVAAVRASLFGAWETNWLAYNFAHNVTLPGAEGGELAFLMYPQIETAGRRLDSLDPDHMKYTIQSRELPAI